MRIHIYGYRTYKYCRRLIVGSLRGPTFYITPTPPRSFKSLIDQDHVVQCVVFDP